MLDWAGFALEAQQPMCQPSVLGLGLGLPMEARGALG